MDAIVAMLVRAFHDDPEFEWLMPSERSRPKKLHRFFTTLLGIELGFAEMDMIGWDGKVAGAAVWFAPGGWPPTAGRQLRSLPGYVRAFGKRVNAASHLVNAAARAHPAQPYRYLACVGVEPATQGRGVGAMLLRSRLDLCDADGVAAYLESSKLTNVPLYAHFGFVAQEPLKLGAGAPVVTPMLRPRPSPAGAPVGAGDEGRGGTLGQPAR